MYHILSFGFYNLNEIYLRIKCLNNSDRVGWKRGSIHSFSRDIKCIYAVVDEKLPDVCNMCGSSCSFFGCLSSFCQASTRLPGCRNHLFGAVGGGRVLSLPGSEIQRPG